MSCEAKIRPFRPVNETELGCGQDGVHVTHEGTLVGYAYEGSVQTISWYDGDRRNFVGEFTECPVEGCLLPDFHGGSHWDEM